MQIISWNVNGLRSVYQKGFLDWFYEAPRVYTRSIFSPLLRREQNPPEAEETSYSSMDLHPRSSAKGDKTDADIVCLQEIKAQENQFSFELTRPKNYHVHFNFAEKKGYSGVVIYSKQKALKIGNKLSLNRFDREGRMLELKFPQFTLINLYLPHGARDKSNLNYKLAVYKKLIEKLEKMKNNNLILIGDFNIAHTEIDLARPKQNKENIMFTAIEREQIDKILKLGYVDTFRKFNKKGGNYTWWPYFANARQRNLGWRIDYCFVSQKLAVRLKKAFILKNVLGSDHCPIGIRYHRR